MTDDIKQEDRPQEDRPQEDRPQEDGPQEDGPQEDGPQGDRPQKDRPQGDRPQEDRPQKSGRPVWLYVGIAVAVLIGFGIGLLVGGGDEAPPPPDEQAAEEEHDHEGGGETIWTCSMHPQIQQSEPGQCPICGMDLIPLEEGSGGDVEPDQVRLTKRARVLAEVRTTPVQRLGDESGEIRLLGRVDHDETRIRTVTAWTAGRIDRLRVATTGQKVRRGQTIATLYSPEIYTAHRDLLQAKRQLERLSSAMDFARNSAEATLESARQKLRLLGVSNAQLEAMEKADKPWTQVNIRTRFGGTVIERMVNEGNYVQAGTGLYRVADLSRLWVQLDAYESDLPRLRVGQHVDLHVAAIPDRTFDGTIEFIDPVVNPTKRTARVRVEVENEGSLRPGMFAEAIVKSGRPVGEEPPLVIPATAPLFSGRRSIVYVEVPNTEKPTYEAREVKLGPKAGDVYPVVAGLEYGERVVIHGAFAIDADLQIRGGESLMTRPDDESRGPEQMIEVPPEFREELRPVVEHYLKMQAALADDDFEAAREAGTALVKAAEKAKPKGSPRAMELWTQLREEYARHAEHLAMVRGIDQAREAFDAFSQATSKLLARFGNPTDRELRVAFCPMAFENRGAEWIQATDEVDNSYFGEEMLQCGEIRHTIGAGEYLMTESAGGEKAGAAGGHQH